MSNKIYNKLVRDNISDIISKDVKTKVIKTCKIKDDNIFKTELLEKLNEESDELRKAMLSEDGNIAEELADIKTVLDAIVEIEKLDWEEIEQIKQKKDAERGKFNNRIYLKSVESEDWQKKQTKRDKKKGS